jgi:predicted nucleic acid-binding Zn ribbon protein
LGRYMAKSRRIVEGTCEVCNKGFTGTTKRRYCSNTCAVRAHRERQRQEAHTDTI